MTSKRELKKRLERLEAQREIQRTAEGRFDGEIDEAVVGAITEFSHYRLEDPDSIPADVVASLPTGFQEQFRVVDGDSEG